VLFNHFLFNLKIFCHIQQHREGDLEQFVLLRDHQIQFTQLLVVVLVVLWHLQELSLSHIKAIDLVFYYVQSCATDLALYQELVELLIVRVYIKNA